MPRFGGSSTAEQVLRDIDLSGKNVLITGVTYGGIGFESALQIAKHKANVYGGKRNSLIFELFYFIFFLNHDRPEMRNLFRLGNF